jgi:hypothetical protein
MQVKSEAPPVPEPVIEQPKSDGKPEVSEADRRRILHLQQRMKQMRPQKEVEQGLQALTKGRTSPKGLLTG